MLKKKVNKHLKGKRIEVFFLFYGNKKSLNFNGS